VLYRAGKLLRRQRLPVGAALLLIASLAGGLYDVNRERVISQRRFSDVRQIANKLFDVDAQVRDLPGSTKARQMIVDTSLEYLTRLAADVQGDPALSLEVGNAYMRVARVQGIPIGPTLGQKDQAEKNLKIADGFIQFVLRKEPGNRIAMLRAAQIAHDEMILARFAHRGDQAHALAVESADWLEKFHARNGDDAEATGILNTYLNVADQFGADGDDERALQLSRRGGEIAKELNRPASAGTFLWVAADVLKSRGDLGEALATIRESVKLLDPGPDWTTKITQTLNFHHALIYEGRILGEVDDVSLGRPEDALPPLQQAFDGSDAIVHRDPKDHSSRGYLAMSAITMGGILRRSDPRRALAVYDHARQHLVEVPGDTHLERFEIRLLAGSSYALRKLGRNAEARERLESAMNKIKERRFYPTDKIDLGSETGDALEALADLEAENGNPPGAIRIYEELLAKMDPRETDAQFSLPDAVHVSIVCSSAAAAYRRADHPDRASATEHRRLEMWQRWAQKLPNNAFVLRQVALTRAKPPIE
jgi:tetratricopeptide (TPR) repeat protein